MIRAWLKRRKAEKEYQALVEQMRSEWRTVKDAITSCYDTSYGLRKYDGDICLACQVNTLGERRVHVVCCPKGWTPQESQSYGEFMLWAAQEELIMPPRKAPEFA